MPGEVWVNLERRAVQIGWDGSSHESGEDVVIEATNVEAFDVHTSYDQNEKVGLAVLTFPPGRYIDDIRIIDSESGDVIAEGRISVQVAE